LIEGLPRLARWLAAGWPPDFSDFDALLNRALETLAIATLGTAFAAVAAAPLCLLASRLLTPSWALYHAVRGFLDGLRAIDSFIFALIFVAAMCLGPFAGIIGVALHTTGSMAKLWSEHVETLESGPAEAAILAGAGRAKIALHTVLPDALPGLTSIALYLWEFNVRASTVLGLVGAGGIGQELKNSIDLLDFSRVYTILGLILIMVIGIDRLSAAIRRHLL
jgi:phosphonate transport system permease protein